MTQSDCEECNDEAIPLVMRLPRPDKSGLAMTFYWITTAPAFACNYFDR